MVSLDYLRSPVDFGLGAALGHLAITIALGVVRFSRSDGSGGLFEHRDEEPFLSAEIVVDHPLAGAGAGGDVVDTGPAEALVGELVGRNLQDVSARPVRIMNPGRPGAAPREPLGNRNRLGHESSVSGMHGSPSERIFQIA